MTIYYLSSVDGSDASDGLSWANAFLTYKFAVETASAAASGPHIVYVDSAHSESLAADTTVTAAAEVRVVCVNRAGGDAPTTGAIVGAQATNYAFTLAGAFKVYVYGMTFRNGTAGTNKNLVFNNSDGGHLELENCKLEGTGTSGSNIIRFGAASAGNDSFVNLRDCTVKFSAAAQVARFTIKGEAHNLTIDAAGTAPSVFITLGVGGCDWRFFGCNLAKCVGTLVGESAGVGSANVQFLNCKFGSGVTIMAAVTTVPNRGSVSVTAYNCNAGDVNYDFYHGDAFGSTTVSATIYATAGAQTAATGVSYKVITTANCSFYTPYVGPWIAKPQTSVGSAVTPSFEILRDGSATAYQDDEVWGEWSYQGTTGYPLAVFVNDRMAVLGTAANQATGALAAGDWTGENATAWFGKLSPGAITPAEVGFIYGRVVVGEPSTTVYYDPQIRVA
jgi:hypothetical protein